MSAEASILAALADYVIDGDDEALEVACRSVRRQGAVDAAHLLTGLAALRGQRADAMRLQRAEVALRAALQLPLRGGAPCRAGAPE